MYRGPIQFFAYTGWGKIEMPGPLPKDAAIRQRTNKTTTRATLDAEPARKRRVPPLPKLTNPITSEPHVWHKQTRAWWREVWQSPMADEYLQADVHGLYRLAILVDNYWVGPSTALAAEIRLEQQCFGLTPIDRRRLQWEVKKIEAAESKRSLVQPETPQTIDEVRRALKVLSG